MGRLYISGPMTGLPELNFPAFNSAAGFLRDLGHEVVNPAELNPEPTASWHECMRRDIKALCDCDTIVLLEGWQRSNGAQLELHVAHRLGMRVAMFEDFVESALWRSEHLVPAWEAGS